MKTKKYIATYLLSLSLLGFLTQSCEAILDESVKSEFTEATLLSKKAGIEAVIADAYGKNNSARNVVKRGEMTTDILWQSGGGEEGTATPLINFNWDPSNTLEAFDCGRRSVMSISCWQMYLPPVALIMRRNVSS